jgi:hypothetical protein
MMEIENDGAVRRARRPQPAQPATRLKPGINPGIIENPSTSFLYKSPSYHIQSADTPSANHIPDSGVATTQQFRLSHEAANSMRSCSTSGRAQG